MLAVDVLHQDGYRFVRVSRLWAKMCSVLPCFDRVRWPDYAAIAIDTTINGVPVVVQLWKGWCPRFLGNACMPGGIGGEVGVYRRKQRELHEVTKSSAPVRPHLHRTGKPHPGHRIHHATQVARHTTQSAIHAVREKLHRGANTVVSDDRLWWPAPELHANLRFELRWKDHVFFRTEVLKDTYWLTQWMDKDEYILRYQRSHDTPTCAWDFTQRYWINGVQQPDWVGHHG